jgi:hypothetical protein
VGARVTTVTHMNIASFIISIVAVVVSVGSVIYARISASAAQRSAGASEGALAIERDRRLEERRPKLSSKIESSEQQGRLQITLNSEEPLAGLDVVMSDWRFGSQQHQRQGGWDVEFNPRVVGVVVPPPGEPALRAFCYDPIGHGPAGLNPHQSITWAVSVKEHFEMLRLDVACHGAAGERWDIVLHAEIESEPVVENL